MQLIPTSSAAKSRPRRGSAGLKMRWKDVMRFLKSGPQDSAGVDFFSAHRRDGLCPDRYLITPRKMARAALMLTQIERPTERPPGIGRTISDFGILYASN